MNETPAPQAPSKGFSIASLVTGILALLCGLAAIVSVPLGIAAIVLGVLGIRKHAGKGMAIAGIITGSLGILIGLLTALLVFMAVPSLQQNARDVQVKSDVSVASAGVYSYMSSNRGMLPTEEVFSSGEFQSAYLSGISNDITFSAGADCEGVSSGRSFTVTAPLADGTEYCQD